MRTLFLVLGALAAGADASALTEDAQDVTVEVRLEEESALPGVGSGFEVEIRNDGTAPAVIPSFMWMAQRLPDGSTRLLDGAGRKEHSWRPKGSSGDLTLEPGQSTTVSFHVSAVVTGPLWLHDPRINRPGAYSLQVIIADAIPSPGGIGIEGMDGSSAIRSPVFEYRVAEPEGEDAEVWKWMRRGRWDEEHWASGYGTFARYVISEHPSSSYARYTGMWLLGPGTPEAFRKVEKFLEFHPPSSYSDHLALQYESAATSAIGTALSQGNDWLAVSLAEKVDRVLENLEINGTTSWARALGSQKRRELKERMARIKTETVD